MLRIQVKVDERFGNHLEEKLHGRAEVFAKILSAQMTGRAQAGEHFPSSYHEIIHVIHHNRRIKKKPVRQ